MEYCNPKMETLIQRIKRHEGLRLRPYKDSVGHPTIGYGHNLRIPITLNAALTILRDDIMKSYLDYLDMPVAVINDLSQNRKEVLLEMLFNLGLNGVLNFKRMIHALKWKQFDKAADEMLDSLWAKQVKSRAIELADIMREG